MTQPLLAPKGMRSIWIKVVFTIWMFLVIFVYLLLFGSAEFWLFTERLGFLRVLQTWKSWLEPFFTASYLQ